MNKPSVSAGVVAGVALGAAALVRPLSLFVLPCLQGCANLQWVGACEARARRGRRRSPRIGARRRLPKRELRWRALEAPVFAYYRAFDDVFEAEGCNARRLWYGIDRMLMLGGGGFAYPKFALMSHEGFAHGRYRV